MLDPSQALVQACKDSWDDSNLTGVPNSTNCSGFVRSVAGRLNKLIVGGQADDLVSYMVNNWQAVASGTDAAALAQQGVLVVAGLKSSDHTPARNNGHVAVIVPGPLYHGKYPCCWCGSSGSAQSQGDKSVGEVWNRSDRDNVVYHRAP